MDKWSIPTTQLTGPRRLGGRASRRGFAFQDAYTCLQMTRLLNDREGVIAVRPEAAQDIDLLYEDGREEYVQLKHEPDEHYTLTALRSILQGFAVDLLEAGRPTTLTFVLVVRSNYINAAAARLRDGEPSAQDITDVAKLLAQSIQGSAAPQCLMKLSEAERRNLADQLLKQTAFSFGTGDEVGGRFSFESHACMELARRGVAGSELQSAFNALKAALDRQREFTRADVEELLKRFIGGAAIELFEGRVEALTDDMLSRPADPRRIQQFYAGARLDWDIIAAHGDIERHQQDDLVRQLSKPAETLRLFCIVAEPGAGKSTLAWRLAVELHRQHGAFIIHIRDKEDADAWYRMADFYQKVRRPFYVLADDLFRDPDVVTAVRELSLSLPITVLATSRANEYRPHRLKGEVVRVRLEEPRPKEKERILQRLGKTRGDLTLEQEQRLDTANQFLVLMMEITGGKDLRAIIEDTLERLQTLDEHSYRAYEYLCFAYQHGISLPTSLLERLDAQGRFHNLPNRETAQGLIFYDEGRTGNVRVGHPVIAETAYRFYEAHRAPANVLQEVVTAVDTSSPLERRFVAHLLRELARAKSPALCSALPRIEPTVARCQQSATRIGELTIWRAFHRNLGQHEQADRCVDAALTLTPVTSTDCNLLPNLYRERGRERDALPVLAEWVRQHPDIHGSRPAYLGLVERYGTEKERDTAINETSAWLAQHPEHTSVWTRYLSLVERQGTPEQFQQVMREVSGWLARNPQDEHVRAAYFGFVAFRCSKEVQKAAINEARQWLEMHPEAKEVWKTLISGLLRLDKIDEALAVTEKALAHHPEFKELLAHYLRITQHDIIDPPKIKQLYEQLVARHPDDVRIRTHYSNWLRDHDYSGEAEAYYKVLIKLPEGKAPKTIKRMAHYGYGLLLLKLERYDEAVEEFHEVLKTHKGHQMAHDGLAQALRALGSLAEQGGRKPDAVQHFMEAESEFRHAIHWAGVQDQPQAIFYTHLGWFYIDRKRYTEALEAFQSAMDEDPDRFENYWGIGRAMIGLRQFQVAEHTLRTALEKAPEDLQPPASEEIPELLRQCQAARSHGDRPGEGA